MGQDPSSGVEMTTEHFIKVLLIIPVYNHGGTLRSVTRKALRTGYEVLVVDDGSTDKGLAILDGLACRTYRLSSNQGKGAAILAGAQIAAADGFDALITIDADGQHDPSYVHALIEKTKNQWPVIVIGNRRMDSETVPRSSVFGRSFSNFWVRLETGYSLPDTQSGFRLYPVHELLWLPVRTRRYDFEIEALVRGAWAGIPANSVSIPVYYPPGDQRISHFNKFRDNIRLSLLHTSLVTRALFPWPHKEIVHKKKNSEQRSLFMHPVRLFKMLLLEHATPLQLASAVWMGVFLGALPFIACHSVVIIYICHKLHLNKMAAVAASQICMPPVVPVLCIQAGFFLRHGVFLTDFNKETLLLQIDERLWEYLLGALVVGPVLGLTAALIMYFSFRFFRSHEPVDTKETERF